MDYKQLFFCAMDGVKVMENGIEILEIDKSDLKKEIEKIQTDVVVKVLRDNSLVELRDTEIVKLKAEIEEIKSQGWKNTMVVLRDSEIEELKEENEELKVNIKKFKKQVEELAEANNIPFTNPQLEEITGYGMAHPDEVYDKDYLDNHLSRFLQERDEWSYREDWVDPNGDIEKFINEWLDEDDEQRISRPLAQDLKNFAIEVHNELYGTKYDDEDIVESFTFDKILKKFLAPKGVN